MHRVRSHSCHTIHNPSWPGCSRFTLEKSTSNAASKSTVHVVRQIIYTVVSIVPVVTIHQHSLQYSTHTLTHIQEVITIRNFSLATISHGTSTRRLEMLNVSPPPTKNTTYQSVHLAFQHSTDSAVVPTMQKYQPKSELPLIGCLVLGNNKNTACAQLLRVSTITNI